MIVSYVRERGYVGDGKDPNVTIGKKYLVFGIYLRPNSQEYPSLVTVLRDSDDYPVQFELKYFDIVDERLPENWVFADLGNAYYRLCSQEFLGDFWERFHDTDEQAERTFQEVKEKLERFHQRNPH